jgi:hypothetical protein
VHAAPAGVTLLTEIRGGLPTLLRRQISRKPLTVTDLNMALVPPMWRRAVLDNPALDGAADRDAYVMCLLTQLHGAARRQDIFAEPSLRWTDPRAPLLDGPDWAAPSPHRRPGPPGTDGHRRRAARRARLGRSGGGRPRLECTAMDPRLHLALLERCYEDDVVEEVRELRWDRRPERYDDLLAVEIPDDVDAAEWTTGADLFGALPDGTDEYVRSLAGIEAYQSLEMVYLKWSEVDDLTPLTKLPALELLWIEVATGVDLTPLLACTGLKRLRVEGIIRSGPTGDDVLHELAARGVQVDDLVPSRSTTLPPFTDPILKLVVLNELDRAGTIDLPKTYFFDDNAFDDDNLDRLMAIELTQEQLDSIESLDWDPSVSRDAVFLVWQQWDGESDEFDITDLTGLDALRNLRDLRIGWSLENIPDDLATILRDRGVRVR